MLRLNGMIAVLAFAGLSMAPAVMAANPASDTIPTNQLLVSYGVQTATTTGQVALTVGLSQATVVNGQLSVVDVDQSADDVVTFTGAGSTVTYDPANLGTDVLPLRAGAVYTVSFKRFNGESYSSSITMPGQAGITQPTVNQVFEKTDAVTINWSAPAVGQPALFALGTNCTNVSGDFTMNSQYTSLTVPAGYVANCSGAVQMEFDALYLTSGTGFGSGEGVSVASILFSYGATLPAPTLALHNPTVTQRLMKALRAGRKTVKYQF